MAHLVTIAAGKKNVILPNGLRYAGGAQVLLSDQEYSELSAGFKSSYLSADVIEAAQVAWVNAVNSFGADPTGTRDSTLAIQNAINSLPSGGGRYSNGQTHQGGGVVYLPAGIYLISSTITVNLGATTLLGDGRWSTYLKYTGTGDCIRMAAPVINAQMGGVKQLMIDGTNSVAPATALHTGDGIQYEIDISIQNFAGTGSIGLHLDNTFAWTEQLHGTVHTDNCTSAVVFDSTGSGYNSFARTDLNITISSAAGQDGVVVQNGAVIYDGSLTLRGNMASSSTTPMSNAVLRLTGNGNTVNNSSTSYSGIQYCRLEIGVETTPNTYTPTTIKFGSGNNAIRACYGFMDFATSNSPFTQAGVPSTSQLVFIGPIGGDKSLSGVSFGSFASTVSGPLGYGNTGLNPSTGNYFVGGGDFTNATLTGNLTVVFNGSINIPQRKTLFITQAAAGGPYTVTWPKPATPNTGSPAVYWPGGTAPVMSTGAGAIDKYVLETTDGIRWYGTAFQNMS